MEPERIIILDTTRRDGVSQCMEVLTQPLARALSVHSLQLVVMHPSKLGSAVSQFDRLRKGGSL